MHGRAFDRSFEKEVRGSLSAHNIESSNDTNIIILL